MQFNGDTGNFSLRTASANDLLISYRGERDYMRDIEPASLIGWTNATYRNLEIWILSLSTTTVPEVDGETAGYLIWQMEPAKPGEEDKGTALIITIAVLPAFRRCGLGGQLLNVLASQARAQGLTGAKLGLH